MPLDFDDIFEAVDCAESLAIYLRSLEAEQNALGIQIQALVASEFEAGIRALQQAQRATDEMPWLLREARNRFNKAVSLETGLKLAYTHLSLALCHSNLGDGENAWRALHEILEVSMPSLNTEASYIKGIGIGAGLGIVLSGPLGWLGTGAAIIGTAAYRAHQSNMREALHAQQSQNLENLKSSVRNYCGLSSTGMAQEPASTHIDDDPMEMVFFMGFSRAEELLLSELAEDADYRAVTSVAQKPDIICYATPANEARLEKLRAQGFRVLSEEEFRDMIDIIFECPKCGQNVRVPAKKGRMRIKCPNCTEAFERDV